MGRGGAGGKRLCPGPSLRVERVQVTERSGAVTTSEDEHQPPHEARSVIVSSAGRCPAHSGLAPAALRRIEQLCVGKPAAAIRAAKYEEVGRDAERGAAMSSARGWWYSSVHELRPHTCLQIECVEVIEDA